MATVINQNQDPNANTQQQTGTAANGQPLQTIGTAQPQSGGTPPGSTVGSTTAPAAGGQPQGSGRFTNLSKYLNANQAGGQRIAQNIGQNIDNNLQQQNQQAQNYYGQLGNSINNANQTAQQGAGYVKQLNSIGQDINNATTAGYDQRGNQNLNSIQNFAQQPDFSNFQNIQAGRGIDENLLAQQQAKALSAAQGTTSAAQQAQQNLGSEGGRFQLLQNQFGGGNHPGYSQGDQRLDQVLLGQSGGLGKVQQSVADQARAAAAQTKLAQGAGNDVSRLTAQEQGLMGDINTAGTNNETAYQNMLKSYIPGLNTDRANQVANLNTAINSYANPSGNAAAAAANNPYAYGFDATQMANLGLTDKNQGVYHVFNKVNGVQSANDIAKVGPDAASAQDVANQGDVDRYGALAKILGNTNQTDLTAPSTIGNAYTANTDDSSLAQRLAAAQKSFDTASGQTLYSANGGDYNAGYLSGTAKDLIQKGTGGMAETDDTLGNSHPLVNDASRNSWELGRYGNNYSNGNMINQVDKSLQNFLTNQNYNQTLGGQRQTYLDAIAQANAPANGKMVAAAPVTGKASQESLNNLATTASLQGNMNTVVDPNKLKILQALANKAQ